MSHTDLSTSTPTPNRVEGGGYSYEPVVFKQQAQVSMPALSHTRSNAVANDIASALYQTEFRSLWIEEILAVLAGFMTLAVGVLGLSAAFTQGPMSNLFVHPNTFKGGIINTSNIGALVAAGATAMASVGPRIITGVSRAWLRRQIIRGQGITIKERKTLASGIAIKPVRKTAFLACGVVLAFTFVMVIHGSALAGVIMPTVTHISVPDTYGPIVPYLNNGGIGLLNSWINISGSEASLLSESIPYISKAFYQPTYDSTDQSTYNSTGLYQLNYEQIYSSFGFMAAVPISAAAGFTKSGIPSEFVSTSLDTPVSIFESSCSVSKTGTDQGYYTIDSYCFAETIQYGNNSVVDSNYIWGSSCKYDEVTYAVEIAVGGGRYGRVSDDSTFGVLCTVKGWEGTGTETFVLGASTTIRTNFSDFHPLSNLDMITMSTGFVEAIKTEAGFEGVSGLIGLAMQSSTEPDDVVNPKTIADRLSNAWAAAATAGYTHLVGNTSSDRTRAVLFPYHNVAQEKRFDWRLQGYGWPATTRLLGWSILCVLVALAWFATAGYMMGGGTQYDPTSWFHAISTSTGSAISQQPGACTGANLRAKETDSLIIWYGALSSNNVDVSQTSKPVVRKVQLYGATKSYD